MSIAPPRRLTIQPALLSIRAALAIIVVATAALLVSVLAPLPRPATAAADVATTSQCRIAPPSQSFAPTVAESPNHAQIWRLYQAAFLRQPDARGLATWVNYRNQGVPLTDIAYAFTAGPEFQDRYGQLSNAQFVRLVYGNVLCRTPEAAGLGFWVDLLKTGQLTRPELVVNFSELREYLGKTGTCHSIYPTETAASPHCNAGTAPAPATNPLAGATLQADGYRSFDRSVARANGSTGAFRGVEVDLATAIPSGLFATGRTRCSVASINANWLVAAQKDQANPGVLGVGVVNGAPAKNSADRTDRGVFGLRTDANPKSVVEVWPGDTLSPDDIRLNSVVWAGGGQTLESWHASAETSPYLGNLEPSQIVAAGEWTWAAAGVPLRIDGQTDPAFAASYAADPYTYQTLNHSFVAVDKNTGRLVFGATANVDARDLLNWATAAGYEDLIMFDGGGSTEFNIGGRAVVAGTGRDIPVWLGIGCS